MHLDVTHELLHETAAFNAGRLTDEFDRNHTVNGLIFADSAEIDVDQVAGEGVFLNVLDDRHLGLLLGTFDFKSHNEVLTALAADKIAELFGVELNHVFALAGAVNNSGHGSFAAKTLGGSCSFHFAFFGLKSFLFSHDISLFWISSLIFQSPSGRARKLRYTLRDVKERCD